jgi:hypothetical protein
MEYCIETSHSLDILCRHWAPMPRRLTKWEELRLKLEGRQKEEEVMPTWIPSAQTYIQNEPWDFSIGIDNAGNLVGGAERQNRPYYTASKGFIPSVMFEKNCVQPRLNQFNGTLHIKGFKIDSIVRLSDRVLNGVIPSEAFELGGWPKKSTDTVYPDYVPQRLWRTLVADRGPDGMNAPTWYRQACQVCLKHTDVNGNFNTNDSRNLGHAYASMAMRLFLERVRAVTWCRKFFLTEGNGAGWRPHYGLAPSEAKENDIICIFFGCSVPVVLRESKEQPGKYLFIGECYVYGMMDGEAMHPDIPPHPYEEVEWFKLI